MFKCFMYYNYIYFYSFYNEIIYECIQLIRNCVIRCGRCHEDIPHFHKMKRVD